MLSVMSMLPRRPTADGSLHSVISFFFYSTILAAVLKAIATSFFGQLMKLSEPQHGHSGQPENGLTGLLLCILAICLSFAPWVISSSAGLWAASCSPYVASGVVVTFRQRWVRFLAIVLAVAGLTLTWMEHIHQAWQPRSAYPEVRPRHAFSVRAAGDLTCIVQVFQTEQ